MKGLCRWSLVVGMLLFAAWEAAGQVEHVPMAHPVYEFLDRLGTKGVLAAQSASMVPLERGEVTALLQTAALQRNSLGRIDATTLEKYLREFDPSAGTRPDDDMVILGSHPSASELLCGLGSDREKYLVAFVDSSVTVFGELLGSMEYRSSHGDSRGDVDATLMTIGGRFRGTIAGRVGYQLQSTNGAFYGNRRFALSDPHLATNVKLNEPDSRNFDVTEAYVRLSFGWASLQLGREYSAIGVGYGDRLMLSDNAPAFDAVGIDMRYKAFRFRFLHGTLLSDPAPFAGLLVKEPAEATKYLALHRFQFSVCDRVNIAASEMVIYQRLSPEFAYLNPVNFFKSAEHSLRDRDNALLMFDVEYFATAGVKLYGSWLIDDISIGKMGSGWWGNEFAWQGGTYVADVAGIEALDAILEYTRIEPYVYSNRVAGNDYTHSGVVLGHSLPPNADQILGEVRLRLSERLRTRMNYAFQRHGQNVMQGDSVVLNVGGSAVQGHRVGDSETVHFLDGNRQTTHRLGVRVDYEPITDLFIQGIAEWRSASDASSGTTRRDLSLGMQVRVEY
jgi:hypothetical protein